MKNAIRGTLQSLAAGDIDKSVSYFAADIAVQRSIRYVQWHCRIEALFYGG